MWLVKHKEIQTNIFKKKEKEKCSRTLKTNCYISMGAFVDASSCSNICRVIICKGNQEKRRYKKNESNSNNQQKRKPKKARGFSVSA